MTTRHKAAKEDQAGSLLVLGLTNLMAWGVVSYLDSRGMVLK